MNLSRIAFSFLCIGLYAQAQAQTRDDGTDLIAPFQAKLAESKKFESVPLLPNIDTARSGKLTYEVPTRLLNLDYPVPPLMPLSIPQDKVTPPHAFYAKAGIGYPLTPLVELSYQNRDQRRWRYGGQYRHHSGRGNLENQRFAYNKGGLHLSRFLDNGLALGGDFSVDHQAQRFYGYWPEGISLPKDSVHQAFTTIGTHLEAYNHKGNAQHFNYRAKLQFYHNTDRYDAREWGLAPHVRLEKWLGSQGRHPLTLETGLLLANFKYSENQTTTTTSRLLFYFNPSFTYIHSLVQAKVGVNMGSSEGSLFIYPNVEVSARIAGGQFVPFIGAQGDVQANTFRSFQQINPFIISNPVLRHTRQWQAYGGLRGSVRLWNYEATVGYQMAQNLPLYLNDSMSFYRRFAVVYDTVNTFYLRGYVQTQPLKGLEVYGRLQSYFYSTRQFEKAYHLPVLDANLGLRYRFSSKAIHELLFRGEFYFSAGIPYWNAEEQRNAYLSPLADFNLGVSCYFTKNIGAFLDLNNIFNNKFQRWHRYPQIGFNAMLGVMMKF
jgi:hypothetical protein